MQYKLSKDQWIEIGKKAGWIKEAKKKGCWVGYKQVGMKNKGGRMVPNCVPKK
jgi:hypothetical protein